MKAKSRMKGTLLALLLALAMVITYMTAPVITYAADVNIGEQELEVAIDEEEILIEEPENDEAGPAVIDEQLLVDEEIPLDSSEELVDLLEEENPENVADTEVQLNEAEEGLSVLGFTSDTHNTSGNAAANRLGGWLDRVESIYGKQVDVMAFGGDMAGAGASGYWDLTQADMNQLNNRSVNGVYTTGNHEISMGGDFSFNTYTSGGYSPTETKGQFEINKVGAEGYNYIVYCLGSMSSSSSYADSISSLTSFLANAGNDRPIFIITHFPLHYYNSRTTSSASNVIDVLNNAVTENGQKIVFLWGHNHTMSDTYYDYIYKPGDSIPTTSSSSSSKEIKFYYGAAGCMSDSDYGTGSGYVKGKGLVVTIDSKNQLTFSYLDAVGNVVSEGGTFSEVAAESISIDEAAASEEDKIVVTGEDGTPISDGSGDPVLVDRVLQAGRSLQLHLTVEPAGATAANVTWESSNPNVATVSSGGRVKGVSTGVATITATLQDPSKRGGTVASIDVAVIPRSSAEPNYIIKIGNYVLSTVRSTDQYSSGGGGYWGSTSTYTGLAAVADSPSAGTDDETRWLIEETDGGYYIMSLDGLYLNATYTTSGGGYFGGNSESDLKLDDTPDVWVLDSGVTLESWEIDGSYLHSSNADRYLCEETGDNGSHLFSVRSRDNADMTTIEEASDPVAVTGVSVSPTEATIKTRKTTSLTATVFPADATNKAVTWSSSNPSVATVGANGTVRGVSAGTATITVTTADGGFTAAAAITVEENENAEQHYVILINGFALSTEPSPNTAQGGSSSYTYTGLAGVAFNSGDSAADNIRWIFEETEGGYYIKDLEGNYLNATYTSGNNSGTGRLKLDNTPDIWTLDAGYSLTDGSVDGSLLKSTNASASATSDKYLGYEDSANLFTVRSEGNADEITVEEASDPIAVTDVTVSPTEATIKARTTTQLTATVLPENATNKAVTWSSSNPSAATVDETGKVKGIAEGEAVITVTTADGGKTASATITVVHNENSQTGYIITIGDFALSTDATTDQLSNNNGAYIYTGLAGVAYSGGEDIPDNIWWDLEETNGGYYIMSKDGKYLNATYTAATNPSASNPTRGVLKLDSTPDVWVLEGTLEDWMIDGSMLKSSNASATSTSDKFLAYEEGTPAGSLNLFTIRSEGNADETTVIDPSVTIEERFIETNTLENGKEYIIAVTKDDSSVYVIQNIAGTSTGNTGSAALTVTPASGSDPAYIVTDDETVVWTYTSNNQYLNTSASHYLGYENSTYLPRTSSQGRAISYSGGKLQIGSGHYLTCDGGTFATATSSGSGATVRLFVKTIAVVSCDHTYGEPVWTWTGDDENGYTAAVAKFTCSKCGDVVTVDAAVTQETTEEATVYTATAAFDGKTYTDTKTVAITYTFVDFTWTGDDTSGYTAVANYTGSNGSAKSVDAAVTSATEDATCTAAGATVYTAVVLEEDSPDATEHTDTKTVTIDALGHDYQLVEGSAVAPTCTEAGKEADKKCSRCDDLIPGEVIPAAGHVMTPHEEIPATCTEPGTVKYYSCSVCEKNFSDEAGSEEIENIVILPIGHDYGTPEYTWAEGYGSVTAKRVCSHDSSHVETETVNATSAITTDPGCETEGVRTYTSDAFENEAFAVQTMTEPVAATGHSWGEAAYTWADDCSTATATIVCANDAAHMITETVETASEVTKPATCEEKGETTYKAVFENEAFEMQTRTVEDVPALGHDWAAPTWTWADDHSQATATFVCRTDSTHIENITTDDVTAEIVEPADGNDGSATYTATVSLDGKTYTVTSKEILKYIPVQSISFASTPKEIITLSTVQIKATVKPANATDKEIIWTSSDDEIATVDANGKVTAKTIGNVTITATTKDGGKKASCSFRVKYYDAYYNLDGSGASNVSREMDAAIYWSADNKITGMPVYYGTMNNMTRGQFVRFLYRYAGNPKVTSTMIKKYGAQFEDVDADYTHFKAIVWAVSKGLIGGYSDGTFKPEKSLSRNNVATILWKFGGSEVVSNINNPYSDVPKGKALAWIKSKNIYTETMFYPNEDCLRGDFAVFLYRYDYNVGKK